MDTTPPAVPEPTPPTPGPGSPAPLPPPSADEKQWKVILYLSPLAGLIVPCGNVIAPLVVWLMKKPEMPTLDADGRKVLNFQISATIYMIASVIIAVVGSCLIVPMFLPVAVALWCLVYTIIGGVKVSNNETFEFPLTIKML